MNRKVNVFVIVFMLLTYVMLAGCVTKDINITPVSEMTPKQKAFIAINVYNRMAESYKQRVALPDLSAAEKTVLNTEYKTMQKAWPAIKMYDDYVQGIITSIDAAIIDQVNAFLLAYRY